MKGIALHVIVKGEQRCLGSRVGLTGEEDGLREFAFFCRDCKTGKMGFIVPKKTWPEKKAFQSCLLPSVFCSFSVRVRGRENVKK